MDEIPFAAAALDRLTKYALKEVSLCSVIERQAQTYGRIAELSRTVGEVSVEMTSFPYAATETNSVPVDLRKFTYYRRRGMS